MAKSVGININLYELYKTCHKDGTDFEEVIKKFHLANRENIHKIFKYKKYEDDFSDFISCTTSSNAVVGTFTPSYDNFLIGIMNTLGLDYKKFDKDDDALTEALMERIERLRVCQNKADLYSNFRELFNMLIKGINDIKEIEKKKNKTEEEKELLHYYYSCAMSKNFDSIIPKQVTLYTRFATKRKEYKELIKKTKYNSFINKNFDMDKVALYLTHLRIKACEEHINDKYFLKKYIRLIRNYFRSRYSKDVAIEIKGQKIDFINICNRYETIKNKLATVDGKVGWVLVPEGKQYKKGPGAGTNSVKYPQSIVAKMASGEAKNDFYEQYPPVLKLEGTMEYKGYIANVYENGEILLDTKYNSSYISTATGNAIYHMNTIWFETISGMDKTTLRQHPCVNKIVHAGSWQQRVADIVTREPNDEEKEQVQEFIQKVKKKKGI